MRKAGNGLVPWSTRVLQEKEKKYVYMDR
jgi:hypothetical protein